MKKLMAIGAAGLVLVGCATSDSGSAASSETGSTGGITPKQPQRAGQIGVQNPSETTTQQDNKSDNR